MGDLLRKWFSKEASKPQKTQKNVLVNSHPRLIALNQKIIVSSKAKG